MRLLKSKRISSSIDSQNGSSRRESGAGPRDLSTNAYSEVVLPFLEANARQYDRLIASLEVGFKDGASAPDVLEMIYAAGLFALRFHPGRFADGRVENIVAQIGRSAGEGSQEGFGRSIHDAESRRRVMHVVSRIGLGGPAPFILNWVAEDLSSHHTVVILNQEDGPPEAWKSAIEASGGRLLVLKHGSRLEKAIELRRLAKGAADSVMWHIIDPDFTPAIAFATTDAPPVVGVDHLDHAFWIGTSAIDCLVQLRSAGAATAGSRRYPKMVRTLPIPLRTQTGVEERSKARSRLGISDQQIVFLSVGRDPKYRPCGPFDFVATASRILEKEPRAHVYIVGESREGISAYLRAPLHPRLHFVGVLDEKAVDSYRRAADVYLESFPFGSQTALLEAALSGLPVVPAYAPLSPVLVANDDSISDLVPNPKDEDAYISRALELAGSVRLRGELGELLSARLRADHVADGWLAHVRKLYNVTDRLKHEPHAVPTIECAITASDLGLALRGIVANDKHGISLSPKKLTPELSRYESYLAKSVGDYKVARRLAVRSALVAPFSRHSWRALGVSVLGRYAATARRILGIA